MWKESEETTDTSSYFHQEVSATNISYSLLLKNLLLVLGPDVHELARLVDLHGVVHEPVHVDELHTPLLRVIHHGRDDR